MKSVIFICTGNICRSPMAHWYMQKKIDDMNKSEEYLISSCGTNTYGGERATQNAIQAIAKYGVNMENHRSTNISDLDLSTYDLIICMTENHKDMVLFKYPNIKEKIFTLKEYVYNDPIYTDIDDPWGYDISVYNSCAKEIVDCVDKLIEKF